MNAMSEHIQRACLGLPLEQALLCCKEAGICPHVMYTGERKADDGLTPRVVAVQENCLVVSLFRDGDPKQNEDGRKA